MKKPKYLYHASSNKNIKVFEPKADSVRHPDEGPVVFATTSEKNASKFIVPCNDSWSNLGRFNGVNYALYCDKAKFIKEDKGGAIYTFSSDNFYHETKFGGTSDEWVSKSSVTPVSKRIYESGLEAMLSLGVQVYFVDKKVFENIKNSNDHGYSIVSNLQSENMRKNINVEKF